MTRTQPVYTSSAAPSTLAVENRPIADLIPYIRNARTHSPAQVSLIAGSIREFGFNNPILIDRDNGVISGHGRLLAAQQLKLSSVPTIELSHLTDAQKRAYVLADNKLAERAGWDAELLALEVGELSDLGIDLENLGFGSLELDTLMSNAAADDREEDTPEPPAIPVSRAGDLWQLGKHRVHCGDATSKADVARVLDGITPTLMVTDPPYGVNYEPAWRNAACGTKTKRTGTVKNDDRADWPEAWTLFPGDVAYVWHAALHAGTAADNLQAAGFDIRSQVIWSKDRMVLSRGHYHWQHEPCWYAVRRGGKSHWSGDRTQTTLWQIPNRDQDADTVHGTQKPVECMRRPMLNNTSPDQAVYDPFLGSGTSIIAAETAGRVCFGLELDPAYVDVIVTRWAAFTAEEPVLAETGETFEVIRNRRAAQVS